MKKIDEAEVKEYLINIRDSKENLGYKVYRAGIYIYKGKADLFIEYEGQDPNEIVYIEGYDKMYEFTDIVKDYLFGEYSTEDVIHIIYINIKNFIESYKEKN